MRIYTFTHTHTHTCMHANEEQEDDQRTGAWKQDERVGLVPPEEENAPGRLYRSLPVPKESL